MPPRDDAASKDTLSAIIEGIGRAVKVGGTPLLILLLVGSVLWLSLRPVTADAPDRYTGTMAVRDWTEQRAQNAAVNKALSDLAMAQAAHEGLEYHTGSRAALATITQALADIQRRLDRIEKQLDGK